MKCDLCDKPAVVHEVRVRNGVKREIHLCEEHAQEAGVSLPGHQPINELLTKFVVTQASKSEKTSRKSCPTCGMKYNELRKTGLIGCPDCYETFEHQLEKMIERVQNGGMCHDGKVPRRAGSSMDRQLQIQRCVRELDEAVAAEQYERAAQIRDHLKNLEHEICSPTASDPQDEESHN